MPWSRESSTVSTSPSRTLTPTPWSTLAPTSQASAPRRRASSRAIWARVSSRVCWAAASNACVMGLSSSSGPRPAVRDVALKPAAAGWYTVRILRFHSWMPHVPGLSPRAARPAHRTGPRRRRTAQQVAAQARDARPAGPGRGDHRHDPGRTRSLPPLRRHAGRRGGDRPGPLPRKAPASHAVRGQGDAPGEPGGDQGRLRRAGAGEAAPRPRLPSPGGLAGPAARRGRQRRGGLHRRLSGRRPPGAAPADPQRPARARKGQAPGQRPQALQADPRYCRHVGARLVGQLAPPGAPAAATSLADDRHRPAELGSYRPVAYDWVPPTVSSSILRVGWPTPTGTPCPSLPQTPMPLSSSRSWPIIETRPITSGPLPIRVAPFTGAVIFPSSTR